MNTEHSSPLHYEAPAISEMKLTPPQDLFTRLSACAEVDDWVDGGELE